MCSWLRPRGYLQVVNPQYLYIFFRGRPNIAWQQSATCFLALTGAEASYADLGHFSVASMRARFTSPCFSSAGEISETSAIGLVDLVLVLHMTWRWRRSPA